MACAAPHPEHAQVTCLATSGHDLHYAYLDAARQEPVEWPNEDWRPPVTGRGTSPGAAAERLRDLAGQVPDSTGTRTLPGTDPGTPTRPVDANVIEIGGDHPETSHEMAARVLPKTGTQRRLVYDLALSRGALGVTDDEIEVALDMLHQSASAARNSLMNDGWLADTGIRRNTRRGFRAIAWVARPS